MAATPAAQVLKHRSEFIKHLKEGVIKNDTVINSIEDKLNALKITTENVRSLGKKVEHTALIPLAFPDSYSTLETLDATIEHLENKIKLQSELLKNSETAKGQLEDRIRLLEEGSANAEDDSPQQIVTDRGVAVKVGDFYEILEFEN